MNAGFFLLLPGLHRGQFELIVTNNGYNIYGSPFHPFVKGAPTSAGHCEVIGDGIETARLGAVNSFTLIARDMFEDERGVGGDNFEVSCVALLTGSGFT